MKNFFNKVSDYLWGESFNWWYLFITASVLMMLFLGAKDLWTQESRWANICQQMILRHDYFHPYLNSGDYYDKPLLSYWLMIGFSYIFGLGRWALRMPGVIAGLISVWCSYKICSILSDRRTGLIAAWMLATTVFFIYWTRVACSDMLNVGGILLAVTWFLMRREKLNFLTYLVLFFIVSAAALCKGLVAPVVIFLILLPILLHDKKWKNYFSLSMFTAAILMAILYVIPFLISAKTDKSLGYHESGLYEVFRENVVRYFAPYDHEGPIYTYFGYLPSYAAPWIVFTLFGIYWVVRKWKSLNFSSKYYFIILVLVFIFFSASGSRRSYYVLPIVPLAIFVAADFVNAFLDKNKIVSPLVSLMILLSIVVIILMNTVTAVGEIGGGSYRFANDLKAQATKIQNLEKWKIVFVGIREDISRKAVFYINQHRLPEYINFQWEDNLNIKKFPVKLDPKSNTIIIIPQDYLKYYQKFINPNDFFIVKSFASLDDRITHTNRSKNFLVAIIPRIKINGNQNN